MTEKELAKKIWKAIDISIASCKAVRDTSVDGSLIHESRVELNQMAIVERKLERIIPRPKKKVKKTLTRWVAVYSRSDGSLFTGATFEYPNYVRENEEEQRLKQICNLKEVGIKEIEITVEVDE